MADALRRRQQEEDPTTSRKAMDTLGGYSSSDDDAENSPVCAESRLVLDPEIAAHGRQTAFRGDAAADTTYAGKYLLQHTVSGNNDEEDERKRKESVQLAKQLKKKRKRAAEDDGGVPNPWAGYEEEEAPAEAVTEVESGPEPPKQHIDAIQEVDITHGDADSSEEIDGEKTSTLFVKYDFMAPARPLHSAKAPSAAVSRFRTPNRVVLKVEGHPGGVTKIKLFPQTSHLLLTCGNDATIKLWDTSKTTALTLVREYTAHRQAVKDVCFSADGTRFISCSYDKRLYVWNTASGEIIHRIQFTCVPTVAIFNPNNESELVVGLSNHHIHHYKLEDHNLENNLENKPQNDYKHENKLEPVQKYTHHLGAINSLTVIEKGRRFMSTADDKSVRFWDWQVNIPVKVISEPTLNSMPCVAVLPPDDNNIALQSMDNKIYVIQGRGKYKFVNEKKFTGHNVVGYGIGINFTLDGRTLMSGDSRGFTYFWDWRTAKVVKRIKLDKKPITCIEAFADSGRVVAAGLGGSIFVCE